MDEEIYPLYKFVLVIIIRCMITVNIYYLQNKIVDNQVNSTLPCYVLHKATKQHVIKTAYIAGLDQDMIENVVPDLKDTRCPPSV